VKWGAGNSGITAKGTYMNDVVKRPGQWLPGQSGNPAGRPLGPRHKIAEQIISTLAADWNGEDTPGVPNGPAAVARLRKEDPSRYVAGSSKRWSLQPSHSK